MRVDAAQPSKFWRLGTDCVANLLGPFAAILQKLQIAAAEGDLSGCDRSNHILFLNPLLFIYIYIYIGFDMLRFVKIC